MQKKYLFGFVIILCAALLLSACGSQATQLATQSATEADPQSTQAPQAETQQTEAPPVGNLAYPSPVTAQPAAEANFASPYPQPAAGGASQVGSAVDSLLATLQGAGLNVSTGGDVTQSFFSVPGKVLTLNGEEIQVYEYPAPEAAEADAGSVSADGGTVGTTVVDWISTPHFFRSGTTIVIYVGESQDVLNALQSLLGSQFAGG